MINGTTIHPNHGFANERKIGYTDCQCKLCNLKDMPRKKKASIDAPMFVFGVVVVGLLASVVFVVAHFFSTNSTDRVDVYEVLAPTEEQSEGAQKQHVYDTYMETLTTLQQTVRSTSTPPFELIPHIEEALFGVKVPNHSLDSHLQAVLELQIHKKESSALPSKNLFAELDVMVQRLIDVGRS